jgi:hypothetical protein
MAELFRYIEQAFVVPAVTPAIDAGRESDLQNSLRSAITKNLPPDQIRSIADNFILKHFNSPVADRLTWENRFGRSAISYSFYLLTDLMTLNSSFPVFSAAMLAPSSIPVHS